MPFILDDADGCLDGRSLEPKCVQERGAAWGYDDSDLGGACIYFGDGGVGRAEQGRGKSRLGVGSWAQQNLRGDHIFFPLINIEIINIINSIINLNSINLNIDK